MTDDDDTTEPNPYDDGTAPPNTELDDYTPDPFIAPDGTLSVELSLDPNKIPRDFSPGYPVGLIKDLTTLTASLILGMPTPENLIPLGAQCLSAIRLNGLSPDDFARKYDPDYEEPERLNVDTHPDNPKNKDTES